MSKKSLDAVTFRRVEQEPLDLTKNITIWVPESAKSKYDELQKKSGREFSKYLRDLVCAAIDNNAESEAS